MRRPIDFRPHRLGKKIAAGAQFVQSQYCFDVPMFRTYMQKRARSRLHRKMLHPVPVSARWPRPRRPNGSAPTCRASTSPTSVIKRLEGAQDQKKEGKQLCIDIINEVKEIPGVSGVHVMAYRQEEYVAEIVDESGVLKGRQPWKRETRARRPDRRRPARHILHDDITETQVDMVKTAH